jgi:hypothetical protein
MSSIVERTLSSFKTAGIPGTLVKIARYSFRRVKALFTPRKPHYAEILTLGDTETKFTAIYTHNTWNSEESVSGFGSTLKVTENIRKELPILFKRFGIQSVFDAPCGDFNWMQHVVREQPLTYIGGDIVAPLVAALNKKYQNPSTSFIHIDLTKGSFPKVDLMICRDCLFHLSFADTKLLLGNFVASGIPYLLTTTYANTGAFQNRDIVTGDFRLIDLCAAPYHFPAEALYRFDDWRAPEPRREMCLWSRAMIAGVLEKFA